jgi:thymidylate synthase (FAD)
MSVRLISITPDCEQHIAYCARVSSSNQENPEFAKLLKYMLDHGHFSPFEMGHMVVEIQTTRAIAAQILRHRSFSFQEFSQRYSSDLPDVPQPVPGRMQAAKNRQSSAENLPTPQQCEWGQLQRAVFDQSLAAYNQALAIGVAREQARMLLPLATPTRLYMAGSIRSWIHYCGLRCQQDTQQEHREIAEQCRDILAAELPIVAEALGWRNNAPDGGVNP